MLGKVRMEKEKVTMVSIDTVSMYRSIKFPLVEKATSFYTKKLPKHSLIKIDLCLRLIGFSTISTLLNFKDNYYEYAEEGLKKGISNWRLRISVLGEFGGFLPL